MPEKPTIVVQLIHIEGPLKGKIEEFVDPVLQIGRHPDCQIRFPKDVTLISRNHAEIVREGNRFKLLDHSANGTFLNGKAIKEAILKNGDVLMIGDGGPKVSFLTEIKSSAGEAFQTSPTPLAMPQSPGSSQEVSKHRPPVQPALSIPKPSTPSVAPREQIASKFSAPKPGLNSADLQVQAPLAIQFGPTIQSFKVLPVTVGKKNDCDYVINHAHIIDRHVQFFYFESNYWVKDLTGQGLITINENPVQGQTPLHPGSRLSLSPQGPVFQFLNGGRLVEDANQPISAPSESPQGTPEMPWEIAPKAPRRKKKALVFLIGFLVILVTVSVLYLLVSNATDGPGAGGLKEWWYRWMETIRRVVGS